MRVKVSRRGHFNAAHRLYRRDWSNEKNEEVFGKCNNPHYHGHNYEVVVSVTGEIDPDTGYVIDMKELKYLIREQVEQYMDHKNLNEQVPEFKIFNPTAEYISVVIYNRLRPHIKKELDLEVVLYETPRNFVTYTGE